jgi:hypothetical protein
METYIAPHSATPQKNTPTTTTTTQSTHNDESTNDDSTKDESTNDEPTDKSTKDKSVEDETMNDESTTNNWPPPIERQFSIYTASYKEMPLMHRPYTNQYKFLVKDFCIHFLNKK